MACGAFSATAEAQEVVSDPWENANRSLFAINESIDEAVLEPVARGYRAVTPRPVRSGLVNFLRNLKAPVILANDVLQGEAGRAGTTLARFGVNTTIGLAGVLDPATSLGLERHDEDFGQTLAVWGVEPGPYVFLPLMGPTNVRDIAGRVVDTVFDPLQYAEFPEAGEARIIRTALTAITTRERLLESVDEVRAQSLDPYVSVRTTYSLLRESAVRNGEADPYELPSEDEIPLSELAPEAAPLHAQTSAAAPNVQVSDMQAAEATGETP
jgi:phospholipid-binding lipoprotein MlaA